MTTEPVAIVWKVTESTVGMTQDYIWRMAVRSRQGGDLTRFLDAMETDGACSVVVIDAEGRETSFHCGLPSVPAGEAGGALAAASAACENQ